MEIVKLSLELDIAGAETGEHLSVHLQSDLCLLLVEVNTQYILAIQHIAVDVARQLAKTVTRELLVERV